MPLRVHSLRARSAAANKLVPSDLGGRISMLFRLTDGGEHPFSEVVGTLQRIEPTPTGDVYVMVRHDGTTVSVAESTIVALKRMPPRVPRSDKPS